MTSFQVVEAKPFHVGMMVRRMRLQHRSILIGLGVNAHRELKSTLDASSYRRSWFIDGQIAALGGITGSLCSSAGYIWLVLSEDALKHRIEIVREARRQIVEMFKTFTEIRATLLVQDRPSHRFAEFLGFSTPEPFSDDLLLVKMERRCLF